MGGNKCSFRHCSNKSQKNRNIRFFRFPKHRERSLEWITLSGNDALLELSEATLYDRFVCSSHFRPDQILSSGRLFHNSNPAPFDLSSSSDEDEPTIDDVLPNVVVPANNIVVPADNIVIPADNDFAPIELGEGGPSIPELAKMPEDSDDDRDSDWSISRHIVIEDDRGDDYDVTDGAAWLAEVKIEPDEDGSFELPVFEHLKMENFQSKRATDLAAAQERYAASRKTVLAAMKERYLAKKELLAARKEHYAAKRQTILAARKERYYAVNKEPQKIARCYVNNRKAVLAQHKEPQIVGTGGLVEVKKEPEEEGSFELPVFEHLDMENFQYPIGTTEDREFPQQNHRSVKSETIRDEETITADVTERSSKFFDQLDVELPLKTEKSNSWEDSLEVDPLSLKQEPFEDTLMGECDSVITPVIPTLTETTHSSAPSFQRPDATDSSFMHTEIHTEENLFKCDHCGEEFLRKSRLAYHMRSHSDERPFKCLQCEKSFVSVIHLKEHILRAHAVKRGFNCRKCEKSFVRSHELKMHIMSEHSGKRLFNCLQCGKSFTSATNRSNHYTTMHIGKGQGFSCVRCEKSFRNANSLKKHMKTPIRLVNCLQCEKSFINASSLTNHMKTHIGERPFNCLHCEKSFALFDDLNKHTKTHTTDPPFNNLQCD